MSSVATPTPARLTRAAAKALGVDVSATPLLETITARKARPATPGAALKEAAVAQKLFDVSLDDAAPLPRTPFADVNADKLVRAPWRESSRASLPRAPPPVFRHVAVFTVSSQQPSTPKATLVKQVDALQLADAPDSPTETAVVCAATDIENLLASPVQPLSPEPAVAASAAAESNLAPSSSPPSAALQLPVAATPFAAPPPSPAPSAASCSSAAAAPAAEDAEEAASEERAQPSAASPSLAELRRQYKTAIIDARGRWPMATVDAKQKLAAVRAQRNILRSTIISAAASEAGDDVECSRGSHTRFLETEGGFLPVAVPEDQSLKGLPRFLGVHTRFLC